MIVQKHEEATTPKEREKITKESGEGGQQHCYRGADE